MRQADFIERSLGKVIQVCRDAAIIVAIILAMFLLNIRATIITLVTIPLSIAVALLTLQGYGGTINVMTLGGLAIAIGEIVDETDPASEPIVRVSRTEAIVEGSTELREVNYAMNVSLPHLENRSLNGFLVERLGRVPAPGEKVTMSGIDIEVVEATETQILHARVRKMPASGSGTE